MQRAGEELRVPRAATRTPHATRGALGAPQPSRTLRAAVGSHRVVECIHPSKPRARTDFDARQGVAILGP